MTNRSMILLASVALGALSGGAALAAPAAQARALQALDASVSFDIPAQPLDLALLAYARQAGVQVISASPAVANKAAPSIRGLQTPRQALTLLLRGSNLTFVATDGGTVTITSGAAVRSAPAAPAASRVLMQAPNPPAPAQPPEPVERVQPTDQLEEVVVTATRQVDTVNRVPLSITAQTQRNLDQQGIRTAADLQATVPALQMGSATGSGVANFSLRGIVQSDQGAATTGFYLDDTPLQKRNAGGVGTANGTPLPPLFDLDRVEVLRGPQGTLYGGSSEGGTIRYIQPQPSLTRYSAYARAMGSIPDVGDESYEAGVAFGGPIVQDKLGFRASVFARHSGGYIDYVDPISGQKWADDTNSGNVRMMRLAATWAVTDRMRVTGSFFSSRDETRNNASSFTLPITNPIVAPELCFNTRNITNLTPGAAGRSNPVPVGRGTAACNGQRAAGNVTYTVPGATYGPYDLKDYQSLANDLSPSATNLQIATGTIDYDFDRMSVKSVTSYIDDQNKTVTSETSQLSRLAVNAAYTDAVLGPLVIPQGLNFNPVYGVPARFQGYHRVSENRRYGLTQELRFSSAGDAKPFSWVAGVYYSNIRNTMQYMNVGDAEAINRGLYGITSVQRYGVPALDAGNGTTAFGYQRQELKDIEIAAFGEGNYWVTDKLRLTAGLRVSRVQFDFSQVFRGPVTNAIEPTEANGGKNSGNVAESPVTPKFSAQYQLTDNDMLYVTAAKGFRAGGINAYVSRGICGPALDQYGLQPADLPSVYNSDSVWSYEAGGKFRLFSNRLQLNGAVYRIDWQNPQITLSPGFGCGLTSTYNAVAARSEGVELEAQARLFRGLTVNGAFGYNDTRYTADSVGVVGPTGVKLITTLKDQKFALPPYTISAGARYDFNVSSSVRAYARADWRYTRGYEQVPFGTAGWNPDANVVPSRTRTNVRVGAEVGDFDVNLFVNNLFNQKKGNITGGRGGCTLPQNGGTEACAVFSTYNPFRQTSWGLPREVGLQIVYRR